MTQDLIAIPCAPDAAAAVVAALGISRRAGVYYEDDALVVPDELAAAVEAALVEAPALAQQRRIDAARTRVVAYADALTARITARYPAAEVASWPTRADEAVKVQGGAAADVTPLITALAAASGQTRAEIAAAILAKAQAYTAVVVAVSVLREQAEAAIAAAPDEAALAVALEALKQAADARAAELGLA